MVLSIQQEMSAMRRLIRHSCCALSALIIVGVVGGCGQMDPVQALGPPMVSLVVGGYWDAVFARDSVCLNSDEVGAPLGQTVERVVDRVFSELDRSADEQRIMVEIAEGRRLYLHHYDLVNEQARRFFVGDIFQAMEEAGAPPEPGEEPGPSLADSWPGPDFWLEPSGGLLPVLAIQGEVNLDDLGEVTLALQPLFRISDISFSHMRFTAAIELMIIANKDFPIIPPFRTLELQRGEGFPVKLIVSFDLHRTEAPNTLGLPAPTDSSQGLETMFPISEIIEEALLGQEDQE